MNFMIFLGTGGGGKVVFSQARASGGLYFNMESVKFLIDPGPGSLVNMRSLKLKDPDGILLSHLHPDHSTDANMILDGLKNSFLIAEEHCLKISKRYYPCISKYQQSLVKFLKPVKAGDVVKIPESEIRIEVTKADHYVPSVGFKIIGSKTIGYPCDGSYFSGQERQFEKCDAIIFNVLVPHGKVPMEHKHMSVDNVITFLKKLEHKPELVIIQHFSFWMLKSNVYEQAKIIEKNAGIKTIAAKDFMKINLDLLKEEKKGLESLFNFFSLSSPS